MESDEIMGNGQLISRISPGSTRWLVRLEDGSGLEKDFSENRFGEILGKVDTEAVNGPATTSTQTRSTRKSNVRVSSPPPVVTPIREETLPPQEDSSSRTDPQENGNASRKKRAVFDAPSDNEFSIAKRASSALAREERSKRRQAQPKSFSSRPSKKTKPSTQKQNCLKVELRTGTLYLYRGPQNRRAEFVRKV